MSRKLTSLSVVAGLLGGTALADVPNVAVDIAPVHSLVARVMDGVGSPNLIIQQGASPHEYSLRPSEARALQNADLVFWIGEDLTPWMEDAVETLAAGATVTSLLDADGTTLLEFREGAMFEAHAHGEEKHDDHGHDDHGEEKHEDHAHDEHGEEKHDDHAHDEHGEEKHDDHAHDDHGEEKHEDHAHDDHGEEKHEDHAHDEHGEEKHDDHAHGDEDHADHHDHAHGEHDPHAWLSTANASVWLNVIAGQLSSADPENAGTYFANAAAAREEMAALSAEISATLAPVRGGRFIVFHDAYHYFEAEFDFPASGAISLSDASDPSPARIAEIQDRINEEAVQCVLAEPQFNPGLVTTVLDGTEARTRVIDPIGIELEPGPTLYPQLMRAMAKTLADCL